MRRAAALSAVVAVAFASAAVAPAKTIRVKWREQKTLASGGAIRFAVTRIDATATSWAVTVKITNASPSAVEFDAKGRTPTTTVHVVGDEWHGGLALIRYATRAVPDAYMSKYYWAESRPAYIRPAPPHTLAAGASWTGTFGGKSKLRRGVDYHVGLGTFISDDVDAGGANVVWITDHSFRL